MDVSIFNVPGFSGINVKDKSARLSTKRIILIGDSYSIQNGNVTGWFNGIVNLFHRDGITDVYTNGAGGAGFAHIGGSLKNFQILLTELYDSTPNPETITDIIVCGGANDSSETQSDILNSMLAFNTYSKEHFPNARIYVGMIGFSTNISARISLYGTVLNAYSKCAFTNFIYLNNVEKSLHYYPYLLEDGLHPNQDGCNMLSWTIYNAFMNGSCSVYHTPLTTNITADTTDFSDVTGQGYDANGILSFNNIVCRTNKILEANSIHTLGKINMASVIGSNNIMCDTFCLCYTSPNTVVAATLWLENDGTLKIQIYDQINASTVFSIPSPRIIQIF